MNSNDRHCRLLTNYSKPMNGWEFYNAAIWAEPKDWKESNFYKSYRCLEKVEISMLQMIMLEILYTDIVII